MTDRVALQLTEGLQVTEGDRARDKDPVSEPLAVREEALSVNREDVALTETLTVSSTLPL